MEISRYIENNKISNIFIEELKNFLNNLYSVFRFYDPYFIIFYDNGNCQQNRMILSNYKENKIKTHGEFIDDSDLYIFRKIKKYYYIEIYKQFQKKDLSTVYYSEKYETDFIPEYCIKNNIFDSNDDNILNIILSVDKDLLQTCKYKNTILYATTFKSSRTGKKQINFGIYNDYNAISYLYDKFKVGILTAKYIPLILAISGDKADNIAGVKGFGVAKSCKLIINNNLPPVLVKSDIDQYPKIIKDNFDLIDLNYKVISFEEQMKRINF